ncbi:hypothetical protein Hypma_007797 [Hypsizygus marmoreus]|uniref:Uncharacterized protein n=1 Tax=Hypsizygus marmoreus TaxID=39966 RepID=A0A369JUA7_HYPMA|nr:hypothetical protein Hypma_007797 [Hypsizygus marmoreus]
MKPSSGKYSEKSAFVVTILCFQLTTLHLIYSLWQASVHVHAHRIKQEYNGPSRNVTPLHLLLHQFRLMLLHLQLPRQSPPLIPRSSSPAPPPFPNLPTSVSPLSSVPHLSQLITAPRPPPPPPWRLNCQ